MVKNREKCSQIKIINNYFIPSPFTCDLVIDGQNCCKPFRCFFAFFFRKLQYFFFLTSSYQEIEINNCWHYKASHYIYLSLSIVCLTHRTYCKLLLLGFSLLINTQPLPYLKRVYIFLSFLVGFVYMRETHDKSAEWKIT